MSVKICIACSPGGHMVQARQLAPVYEKYDYFFFTFRGSVADELAKKYKVQTIPNVVRNNPLSWITGFSLSMRVAFRERPDVIITTGAGVVVFFCYLCKLLGAKIIFIESMAKIEKPTLTSRMLYPIANLFFVQWPNLKRFFPRAIFAGRLL